MSNLEKIIKFVEQNPQRWRDSYGDEGFESMREEVVDYFRHYSGEEGLEARVMLDLGYNLGSVWGRSWRWLITGAKLWR